MGLASLFVCACFLLSITAHVTYGDDFYVVNIDQLRNLTRRNTQPYIAMKNERQSLAELSARDLFGTIAQLEAPLEQTAQAIRAGVSAAVQKSGQLSGLFRGLNQHLGDSLDFLQGKKEDCAAGLFFGEEAQVDIPDVRSETVPEFEEADDVIGDVTDIREYTTDELRTTGAEDRIADVLRQFKGLNPVIKLDDAMQVFSASARMCDLYAAKRVALYLNKASLGSEMLKAQLARLQRVADTAENLLQLLSSFDSTSAFNLVSNVHNIKKSVTALQCSS